MENRKLSREILEPLDGKGINKLLKENGEMLEKLNYFFVSAFAEIVGYLYQQVVFSGKECEELGQTKVTKNKIQGLLGKIKINISRS